MKYPKKITEVDDLEVKIKLVEEVTIEKKVRLKEALMINLVDQREISKEEVELDEVGKFQEVEEALLALEMINRML